MTNDDLNAVIRRTEAAAAALGITPKPAAPGGVSFSDAVSLSDRRSTRDGYVVLTARAARTGIQTYRGGEVGRPDLNVVRVFRPEAEVFSRDSLGSYAHKPITVDHPTEPVSSRNWKTHAVGHVEGNIARDGEFVRIALMLADAGSIAELDRGKREISVGYECDLDWTPGTSPSGEAYDARQTNIRVNHVALVARGRAGPDCSVPHARPLDALPPAKDTAMTMTFNDAVAQVPDQFQFKVMQTIGALAGSGSATRWAIDDANGLIMHMEMTAAGHYGSGGGLTTDATKDAVTVCVDHLRSAVQAAEQRLAAQGR